MWMMHWNETSKSLQHFTSLFEVLEWCEWNRQSTWNLETERHHVAHDHTHHGEGVGRILEVLHLRHDLRLAPIRKLTAVARPQHCESFFELIPPGGDLEQEVEKIGKLVLRSGQWVFMSLFVILVRMFWSNARKRRGKILFAWKAFFYLYAFFLAFTLLHFTHLAMFLNIQTRVPWMY